MSIGTPVERYAVHRTAQTTTTTLSPTGNIAAGSVAVLCGEGSAKTISSVSDDAGGNTWTVHVAYTGNGRSVSFATCPVATQIGTGNVITITWVQATSLNVGIWVQEVTGLSASPFDVSATGTGASGTAVSTSATATLAQADEICFAGFRTQNNSTWTPGGTWTNVTTPLLNSNQALEYKIVAATTGVTGDGTFSVSGTWAGAVITLKGAGGNAFTTEPAGAVTPAGALAEKVAKAAAGAPGLAGTIAKHVGVRIDETYDSGVYDDGPYSPNELGMAGALTPTFIGLQTTEGAGSIIPTGVLGRGIAKLLAGVLTPAGELTPILTSASLDLTLRSQLTTRLVMVS